MAKKWEKIDASDLSAQGVQGPLTRAYSGRPPMPVSPKTLTPQDISNIESIENEIIHAIQARNPKWMPDTAELDLNLLPRHLAEDFRRRLDSIYDVQNTLLSGTLPHVVRPMEAGLGNRGYGRFLIDSDRAAGEVDPALLFWSRLNVRLGNQAISADQDITDLITTPFTRRRIQADLYQAEIINEARKRAQKGLTGYGRKMMVVDTETASLNKAHGMRELSWHLVDESGDVIEGSEQVFHMRNRHMRWGTVYDETAGASKTVEDFLGLAGQYSKKDEALRSFLSSIKDVDYNLMAYNANFDVKQIRHALETSPLFHTDAAFKRDAMEFIRITSKEGRVFDILESVRTLMPNLGTAPSLLAKMKYTTHSHENILLSTNILEIIKKTEPENYERALEALSNLHAGSHDTWLESRIAKWQMHLSDQMLTDPDIIKMITDSSAVIPRMRLGINQINPAIKSMLETHGLLDTSGEPMLTAFEHMVLESRSTIAGKAGSEIDFVSAGRAWERLARGLFYEPDVNLLHKSAREAGAIPGLIRTEGALMPENVVEDFAQLKKVFADANLPYAGLSIPERHLTAMFGSSMRQGGLFEQVYGGLMGLSSYIESDIGVFGQQGQIVAMPKNVLERALGADQIDRFSLSPFSTRKGGIKDIGYTFRFGGDDQLEALIDFMRNPTNLAEFGIEGDMAENIIRSLREHGMRTGVQVGTYGAVRNERKTLAAMLHDVLVEQRGGSVDRSFPYTDFSVVNYGAEAVDDGGLRRVGVGPVFMDKAADPDFVASLREDALRAEAARTSLLDSVTETHLTAMNKEMLGSGSASAAAEEMLEDSTNIIDDAVEEAANAGPAMKINEFWSKHLRTKKGFPKGAVALIAAVGTAVGVRAGVKRYHDWRQASEPFEEQRKESDGWHERLQAEIAMNTGGMPRQRMDYLQTAGVTSLLDSRKIGHHRMGSDKYNHLYGR